jgi:methylphosphotriester-DNA--protein-cysteine methyltransferase
MPLVAAAEMSRYASKSEVLAKCRALAAHMPDGIYPGDGWLRKRGKHANRPGPPDNALSVYVNRLLGGTRAVRQLLGQSDASTIKWTTEKAVAAWDAFEAKTGLTPSQCMNTKRRSSLPAEIRMEARKIYEVVSRLGQLEVARKGRSARRVIWTPEHIRSQWHAFARKHGRTPSECMSKVRRQTMPRSVTDEATRIYEAARRLGLLAELRGEDLSAAK